MTVNMEGKGGSLLKSRQYKSLEFKWGFFSSEFLSYTIIVIKIINPVKSGNLPYSVNIILLKLIIVSLFKCHRVS